MSESNANPPSPQDEAPVAGAVEIHLAKPTTGIPENRSVLWRRLSAVPDFVLAGAALLTWIAPQVLGVEWIKWMLTLLMFEFLALHATGFFSMIVFSDARKSRRGATLLVLASFYTIFAGMMSVLLGQWSPLIMLSLLALKHAGHIVTQLSEQAKRMAMVSWGLGLGAYLTALLVTTPLPLPKLGVTDAVRTEAAIPGKGVWVNHPQRALAACALYFTAVGLLQFFGVAETLSKRSTFTSYRVSQPSRNRRRRR